MSQYFSNAQKSKLVELLQNEPDLLSGKFSPRFTYKEGQKKMSIREERVCGLWILWLNENVFGNNFQLYRFVKGLCP
jgi:hypothetical protein